MITLLWNLRRALSAVAIAALAHASAASPDIMVWGPQATEQAAKFATSVRFSCRNDPPDRCIKLVAPVGRVTTFAVAFTNPAMPEATLERAQAYSKLSREHPALVEAGLDDFVAFVRKIEMKDKAGYLLDLAKAIKSNNPDLRIGVTLYEYEIDEIRRRPEDFPERFRRDIGRVALFLSYRENWENLPAYIEEAKKLFPNAKMYGGVYHYDRRDYRRCDQSRRRACTNEDEIRLFKNAMALQMSLLRSAKLDGLELYPGFVGTETTWKHWSNPAICSDIRRSECGENSRVMSQETVRALTGLR